LRGRHPRVATGCHAAVPYQCRRAAARSGSGRRCRSAPLRVYQLPVHDRLRSDGCATEADAFNWPERAGGYIRSRVEAENLVLGYARERGLPAVAMCVSNTYGPLDFGPTPHGMFVAAAAGGKVPFYIKGAANEVVGIEDAAAALLLAADKGRNGERYIVSERMLSARELAETSAAAVGARPPKFGVPLWVMYALGYVGDVLRAVRRRDLKLCTLSVRLLHIMPPMDHGKAERELGWRPAPVHDAIRRAAVFYLELRRDR
jgi:dihydroflavonol-4-reductase